MSNLFRDLHQKEEDFITSAIRAIGNFFIHEERMEKQSDN
jgi:hypothetical protein